MAFDVDLTTYEGTALPWDGKGRVFVAKKRVDFTATANNLANAKRMAIMNLPANAWIISAYMKVITANTGVTDVDLGLFTTAAVEIDQDGLLDGATLETAGFVTTPRGELDILITTTGVGYLATTASVLTLYNNDATSVTLAVVDFFVQIVDFGF